MLTTVIIFSKIMMLILTLLILACVIEIINQREMILKELLFLQETKNLWKEMGYEVLIMYHKNKHIKNITLGVGEL